MPAAYDVVEVSPEEFARETGAQLSRDVTKVIWAKDRDAAKHTTKVSAPLSKHRPTSKRHLQPGAKWIVTGPPRLLKAGTRLVKVPNPSSFARRTMTNRGRGTGRGSASRSSADMGGSAPPALRQRTLDGYRAAPRIADGKKKTKTLALKQNKAKKQPKKDTVLYMSPKGKEYPPIQPLSLGNFLCVNDLIREAHASSISAKQLFIFSPSIRGTFQVLRLEQLNTHLAGSPVDLLSSYFLSPTWKYQAEDTPIVYRPLRASLTIKNLSPADKRENGITVLNTSSPLVLSFCDNNGALFGSTGAGAPDHVTEATFDKLWAMVHASPDSKFYSANQLSTGHNEIVSFPCTSSAYGSYGPSKFNSGGGWTAVAEQWKQAETDMPMSHIMVAFTHTSVANNYTMEMQTQAATRYDEGTLLGSLMKGATGGGNPQAADAIFNTVRNNGSNLLTRSGH